MQAAQAVKIQFVELDFSNLIFQKSSADGWSAIWNRVNSITVRGHANKFAPPSHISLIDVKFNLPHNTYIRYYVHTYKTNLVAMVTVILWVMHTRYHLEMEFPIDS